MKDWMVELINKVRKETSECDRVFVKTLEISPSFDGTVEILVERLDGMTISGVMHNKVTGESFLKMLDILLEGY